MKLKAALVLTMLVFASLISLSNRCKKQCDGRTMLTVPAAAPIVLQPVVEDSDPSERELAGSSPLVRMAVIL